MPLVPLKLSIQPCKKPKTNKQNKTKQKKKGEAIISFSNVWLIQDFRKVKGLWSCGTDEVT